jgi:hypothetical protein
MTVGFWKPHKQSAPAKPYSEVYVSALLFATQPVSQECASSYGFPGRVLWLAPMFFNVGVENTLDSTLVPVGFE